MKGRKRHLLTDPWVSFDMHLQVIYASVLKPCEVAIKCSLLSESLPSHMPSASKDAAFASFEVHRLSKLCNADHGMLFESSLIWRQSVIVNKVSMF
jgi:hypothetical protein